MAKYVKYNGGKESYYNCTNPKQLSRSTIYEVIYEDVGNCQTNYTLKGVDGYFNSAWFKEIPTYIAVSLAEPKLSNQLVCFIIVATNESINCKPVTTSIVTKVRRISENTYSVFTENSHYIVQVS